MNQDVFLELEIKNANSSAISQVVNGFPDAKCEIAPSSRTIDPTVLVGIIGGSIGILNGLLELGKLIKEWNKDKKSEKQIVIIVRDEKGIDLNLNELDETQIRMQLKIDSE